MYCSNTLKLQSLEMSQPSQQCLNTDSDSFILFVIMAFILLIWIFKAVYEKFRRKGTQASFILHVFDKFRKEQAEKDDRNEKHSQEQKQAKLFFDFREFLWQYTFLEQFKDYSLSIKAVQLYQRLTKYLWKTLMRVLIFLIDSAFCYLLPVEVCVYSLRVYVVCSSSGNVQVISACFQVLEVLLSAVRLFCILFLVSMICSRIDFLRITPDSFERRRWIYRRIEFHILRALYMTLLCELIRNSVNIWMAYSGDSPLQFIKERVGINLITVTTFIIRELLILWFIQFFKGIQSHISQDNDLVYKEQKKLWYIKTYLQRYLPDAGFVKRLYGLQEIGQMESRIKEKFEQSYDQLDRDMEIMLALNCKSIVSNRFLSRYDTCFAIGIIFIWLHCLFFTLLYLGVIFFYGQDTRIQINMTFQKLRAVRYIQMIFYIAEALLLPALLAMLLNPKVLFDSQVLENINTLSRTEIQMQPRQTYS